MNGANDDEETFLLACMQFLTLMHSYINAEFSTRRWWVRPINAERKKKGAFMNLFKFIKTSDNEMFFKYTRMLPEQFDELLNLLKPKLLKRSRREFLSPNLRLALTLKYLAHGGSFQNIAWEFRVGHSTVSKVIIETCEAIWDVLQPLYLKTPNENEWHNVSDNFWDKWNFPHTLGAIDGKHIHIQCPIKSGSQYYNYKKYFSIVLLACCDADYKFLWVDIGAYGSEHDAGVFRRSKIGQDLDNGSINLPVPEKLYSSDTMMPYYFVGDEAFPLKAYIMRPYAGKYLGQQKLIFNYRLSRARRVIENAFGILASRWRVYRAPLLCSVKTTEAIVKATLCLHNYLRTKLGNQYSPQNLIDRPTGNGVFIGGEWRDITENDTNLIKIGRMGSNISTNVVYKLRDKLSEYLLTDAGSVPWQINYVNRGSNIGPSQ